MLSDKKNFKIGLACLGLALASPQAFALDTWPSETERYSWIGQFKNTGEPAINSVISQYSGTLTKLKTDLEGCEKTLNKIKEVGSIDYRRNLLDQGRKCLEGLGIQELGELRNLQPHLEPAFLEAIKKSASVHQEQLHKELDRAWSSLTEIKTKIENEANPQEATASNTQEAPVGKSRTWGLKDLQELIPSFAITIDSQNFVKVSGELPKSCLDSLKIDWKAPDSSPTYDQAQCGETLRAIQFYDTDGKAESCIQAMQKQGPFLPEFSPKANWSQLSGKIASVIKLKEIGKSGKISIAHYDEANRKIKCEELESPLHFQTAEDKAAVDAHDREELEKTETRAKNWEIANLKRTLNSPYCRTEDSQHHVKSAIESLFKDFKEISHQQRNHELSRLDQDVKESQLQKFAMEVNAVNSADINRVEDIRGRLVDFIENLDSHGDIRHRKQATAHLINLANKICHGDDPTATPQSCSKAIEIVEKNVMNGSDSDARKQYGQKLLDLKINRLHTEVRQGNLTAPMIQMKEGALLQEWTQARRTTCRTAASLNSEECTHLIAQRDLIIRASQIANETQMIHNHDQMAQSQMFNPGSAYPNMMGGMGMNPIMNPMMGGMGGMGMMNPIMNPMMGGMGGMGMNPMMNPMMGGMGGMGMNPMMNPMMGGMGGMGMNPMMNPMMGGMGGMGMNPMMNPMMGGMGGGTGMPGQPGAPGLSHH